MEYSHIALNEMDPVGLEVFVDDSTIWSQPSKAYGLSYKIIDALQAKVLILPQTDGCLIRGKINGVVALPCDRCTKDSRVDINYSFEEFEEFSSTEAQDEESNLSFLESGVLFKEDGRYFLDLHALLWEEFSLALPVKPLCRPGCKGLCPACGKDLNEGECGCRLESGDPRLAVFRHLKLKQ